MDSLRQLFHSMPYDIKEKILSFTYKTQPKGLLAEIKEYVEMKLFLNDFAVLVGRCHHHGGVKETTDDIYEFLRPGLAIIQLLPKKLVKQWRYSSELYHAEESHSNGLKYYTTLNWEASFAVYFWMCVYH